MIQNRGCKMSTIDNIRNISYKELIHWQFLSGNASFCLLEIYPIRNWYNPCEIELNEDVIIRNISYKELIQKYISLKSYSFLQLEIYPIRNWYAEYEYPLIFSVEKLEIYPIRNWYNELLINNLDIGKIRNISYKELIHCCQNVYE